MLESNGTAIAFDSRELRQVLGSFVTGVTVITTLDANGKPHGLTANSFLASAAGLGFAAWLPRDVTAPLIQAELARGANGQPLAEADVATQLAGIRASGIVRLVGTNAFADLYGTSISAISAPVFDQSGAMVLALTAIGASDRLDISEPGPLVTRLRECAATLSQRLGATPAGAAGPSPVLQENRP